MLYSNKTSLKINLFSSVVYSPSNYSFNRPFMQLTTHANPSLYPNTIFGDGHLIWGLTRVSKITGLYKELKFSQLGPLYSPISFNGTSRYSTLKTVSAFPVTREPTHSLWLGAFLLVVPCPDHSLHHSHLPKAYPCL